MDKNVMIPRSTLERVIVLLESADLSRHPNCYDYFPVIWELKVKMQKLELREAYTRMVRASDEYARHEARIEYLRQKSQLGTVDVGDIPY